MHRTVELATFVSSVTDIPSPVRHAAKRVLLDTIGAAIAGAATAAGAAASTGATVSWGEGPGRVWFSDARLRPAAAAFVNSAYASMLDLDDGHRAAAGHPGAAIVPAALTIAEIEGATPDRMLAAIALGYEVALRISAARDINSIRTTDTGRWCGYGVVAAAGWLKRLPAKIIAEAMAIAGHTASSQSATGWTKLGHAVKEGIAFATANALMAVDLALAGYTGPLDLLDDPERYDQNRLVANLGCGWEIEKGYFKIYSACRWAHAPIDGALALQAKHAIKPEEIEEIEIGLFARALTLLNKSEPESIEVAQYSIPFSVALALVHGSNALLPVTAEFLKDTRVTSLARRVKLVHRRDLDPSFPAMTPATVRMGFAGRYDQLDISAPKGEPTNALSDQELHNKFTWIARGRMAASGAERLKAAIWAIDGEIKTDHLFQAIETRVEQDTDAPIAALA
ncbi:Immune-responsive protein 1 (plasmid) [Sinorhizobium fredii CCBAU 83666]|uniref:MmgE/PrpD family protein n=2 Tax=Rhizobium fredii TaxID=380 RepID=UPI000BAC68BD|nr:MmgE/PrpD family protein [Sinorhizobium fredii]ASY73836.1 Immune-responsive protein 1 [Sinorhizobium fredii CCBAU 83666]